MRSTHQSTVNWKRMHRTAANSTRSSQDKMCTMLTTTTTTNRVGWALLSLCVVFRRSLISLSMWMMVLAGECCFFSFPFLSFSFVQPFIECDDCRSVVWLLLQCVCVCVSMSICVHIQCCSRFFFYRSLPTPHRSSIFSNAFHSFDTSSSSLVFPNRFRCCPLLFKCYLLLQSIFMSGLAEAIVVITVLAHTLSLSISLYALLSRPLFSLFFCSILCFPP